MFRTLPNILEHFAATQYLLQLQSKNNLKIDG